MRYQRIILSYIDSFLAIIKVRRGKQSPQGAWEELAACGGHTRGQRPPSS